MDPSSLTLKLKKFCRLPLPLHEWPQAGFWGDTISGSEDGNLFADAFIVEILRSELIRKYDMGS
jgi:hypothetical protein